MTQSQPSIIPNHLLSSISGGHVGAGIGLIFLLEIPHMIIGFIEFTNYIAGHWVNGCTNVAEDDYFGAFLCGLFSSDNCSGDSCAI